MLEKEIDKNNLMQTGYYYPQIVKANKLSLPQRDLVRIVVKLGPVTTQIIAEIQNISVVNASTQLGLLFERGYLQRVEEPGTSGGIRYQYSCDPKKWG